METARVELHADRDAGWLAQPNLPRVVSGVPDDGQTRSYRDASAA